LAYYEIVISTTTRQLSLSLSISHRVTLSSGDASFSIPRSRSKWDSALIPASNAELRTDDIAIRLVTVDRMSVRLRCERVYARHASRAWFRQFRSPQLHATLPFNCQLLPWWNERNRRHSVSLDRFCSLVMWNNDDYEEKIQDRENFRTNELTNELLPRCAVLLITARSRTELGFRNDLRGDSTLWHGIDY
jgi:hypothetical protein